MYIIGEIKAIINERNVLIFSSSIIKIHEELTVYHRVIDNRLKELTDSELYFPIGSIFVLSDQSNNYYLAERYRESEPKKEMHLAPKFLPSFADFIKQSMSTYEIENPGSAWSVEFDEKNNLNIGYSKILTVGDPVGRLEK